MSSASPGATIVGSAFSSSTSRSMAPAARCTSPHISLSAAADRADVYGVEQELAELAAGHLLVSTACAPIQSTIVMAPNTSIVASAVSTARTRVRFTATLKESSTAPP